MVDHDIGTAYYTFRGAESRRIERLMKFKGLPASFTFIQKIRNVIERISFRLIMRYFNVIMFLHTIL